MRTQFLVPLLVGALALGACGGDDDDDTSAAGDTTGATTTTAAATAKVPDNIVSLSATATEMLFAIGAGDQVVAVDDQSDYPEGVPITDLSGYEPNVEAIAGYDPDLVIMSDASIEDELARLDIPLLVQEAAVTLDDTYAQITELGERTGHVDEATDLTDSMKRDIEEILAGVPASDTPLNIYHELDDTYYSASSNSFIGALYGMVGLENIADEADADGTGYPQLSAEYILDSNPDIVFLADSECCGQSAETVAVRPGWDVITAVKEGNVVVLGDDVASRWGPRVVELLQKMVDAANEAQAA